MNDTETHEGDDGLVIPFEDLDIALGALAAMNQAFIDSPEGQEWLDIEMGPVKDHRNSLTFSL